MACFAYSHLVIELVRSPSLIHFVTHIVSMLVQREEAATRGRVHLGKHTTVPTSLFRTSVCITGEHTTLLLLMLLARVHLTMLRAHHLAHHRSCSSPVRMAGTGLHGYCLRRLLLLLLACHGCTPLHVCAHLWQDGRALTEVASWQELVSLQELAAAHEDGASTEVASRRSSRLRARCGLGRGRTGGEGSPMAPGRACGDGEDAVVPQGPNQRWARWVTPSGRLLLIPPHVPAA